MRRVILLLALLVSIISATDGQAQGELLLCALTQGVTQTGALAKCTFTHAVPDNSGKPERDGWSGNQSANSEIKLA
jgi:hypothetical protein